MSRVLPTAPDRRLAGGLLLLVALLAAAEVQVGRPAPVALGGALILAFGALCLVHLETAFALILALAPFSIEMVAGGTGSALQIPTEPMLFLALAAWGLRFLARGSTTFRQPGLSGALLLALAACLVSAVDTKYPALAAKAILNAAWYAAFGLFIVNNFADRNRLAALRWAWIVPGVIICAYSLGSVMSGHYIRQAGFWWSDPFFTEHGTFSAYLSFVCALSLALTLELPGRAKLLFGAVAMLSGAQIILSLTRGAWMGLVVLSLFLALVAGRRLLRPANLALGFVGLVTIGGLIVASGALSGLERHSETITDPGYVSNLERINRWWAGWRMFQADPWTGVGFGTYADNYLDYRRIPLGTEQSTYHMSVHSEYLKVLSETGILGVAAAALVLIVVAGMARRAIRDARDPLLRGMAVGMTGGLLTYLVHGLVNNYMVYDKAAVPVWVAVGTLAAIDRINRS